MVHRTDAKLITYLIINFVIHHFFFEKGDEILINIKKYSVFPAYYTQDQPYFSSKDRSVVKMLSVKLSLAGLPNYDTKREVHAYS